MTPQSCQSQTTRPGPTRGCQPGTFENPGQHDRALNSLHEIAQSSSTTQHVRQLVLPDARCGNRPAYLVTRHPERRLFGGVGEVAGSKFDSLGDFREWFEDETVAGQLDWQQPSARRPRGKKIPHNRAAYAFDLRRGGSGSWLAITGRQLVLLPVQPSAMKLRIIQNSVRGC